MWSPGPLSPRTPTSQYFALLVQAPVPPVMITPFPFAVVASAVGWLGTAVAVNAFRSATVLCWLVVPVLLLGGVTPMMNERLCQITSFAMYGTE